MMFTTVLRVGQEGNLGLIPYGDWWRRHRRALWQHFTTTAVGQHQETQRQFARLFARKLLDDPREFRTHIR